MLHGRHPVPPPPLLVAFSHAWNGRMRYPLRFYIHASQQNVYYWHNTLSAWRSRRDRPNHRRGHSLPSLESQPYIVQQSHHRPPECVMCTTRVRLSNQASTILILSPESNTTGRRLGKRKSKRNERHILLFCGSETVTPYKGSSVALLYFACSRVIIGIQHAGARVCVSVLSTCLFFSFSFVFC